MHDAALAHHTSISLKTKSKCNIDKKGYLTFFDNCMQMTIGDRSEIFHDNDFKYPTELFQLNKARRRINLDFVDCHEAYVSICLSYISTTEYERTAACLKKMFKRESRKGMLQSKKVSSPTEKSDVHHQVSSFYGSSPSASSLNFPRTPTSKTRTQFKAVPLSSNRTSLTQMANEKVLTSPSGSRPTLSQLANESRPSSSKTTGFSNASPLVASSSSAFDNLDMTPKSQSTRSRRSLISSPSSNLRSQTKDIELVELDADQDYDDIIANNRYSYKSLRNVGNSCYINATLQALSCLDRFRKRLFRITKTTLAGRCESKTAKELDLLICLDKILKHLSFGYRSNFNPKTLSFDSLNNFRARCGNDLGKHFASYDQQDASEFLNNLLDYMQTKIIAIDKSQENIDNPADLFRLENNKLISCKCGATRNKCEPENILTVSAIGRKPTMQNLVEKFFEKEKVKLDCESCNENSRLTGLLVSLKKIPTYLAVTVRRYEYKSEGAEKLTKAIRVNREIYLKNICHGSNSKADETVQFCRTIRDASESPRKNIKTGPLRSSNIKSQRIVKENSFSPTLQMNSNIIPSRHENILLSDKRSPILQRGGAFLENDDDEIPCKRRKENSYDEDCVPDSSGCSDIPTPIRHDSINTSILPCSSTSVSCEEKKRIYFKPLKSEVTLELQALFSPERKPVCDKEEMRAWIHSNLMKDCVIPLNEKPHTRNVDGDGNCLFRCLSWYIFGGSEKGFQLIRQSICDFMELHKEEFSGHLPADESDMDHYIQTMRQDSIWGTNVEISAAATLMQCVIYSYLDKWQVFRPLFKHEKGNFIERIKHDDEIINEMIRTRGAIYIYNDSNVHFAPAYAPRVCYDGDKLSTVQSWYLEHSGTIARRKKTDSASDHDDEEGIESNSEYDYFPELPYEYTKDDDPVYTLVSVVSHLGSGTGSGHYTSFCYESDLGVWLHCDDIHIKEVDEQTVLRESGKNGYMFFYERRREGDEQYFSYAR